jgi:predicted nucleotidyltransferase
MAAEIRAGNEVRKNFEASSIPEDARGLIQDRLDMIERKHDVRVLFAVESGSRAWGFPSPDSDFDVRFVYVHQPDWYLSIDARHDVIELPIEDDLDINGWELRKALRLLIKPNPVLLEWIRSPIIYRADRSAMAKIAALGESTEHLRPSTYHYLRLADSTYRRSIDGAEEVVSKKYFYCLRPVLALAWLRKYPQAPVPMTFSKLKAGAELSAETERMLDELLLRKAASKELGRMPRAKALDSLIEQEIEMARTALGELPTVEQQLIDKANALFREIVTQDRNTQ